MGGHGGLNILPQKKWNVYNYDNRAIVEKDKRKAAEKLRNRNQFARRKMVEDRLDVLADERGSHKGQKDGIGNGLYAVNCQLAAQTHQNHNILPSPPTISQLNEKQRLTHIEFLTKNNLSDELSIAHVAKEVPWYQQPKGAWQKDDQQRKELLKIKELQKTKHINKFGYRKSKSNNECELNGMGSKQTQIGFKNNNTNPILFGHNSLPKGPIEQNIIVDRSKSRVTKELHNHIAVETNTMYWLII